MRNRTMNSASRLLSKPKSSFSANFSTDAYSFEDHFISLVHSAKNIFQIQQIHAQVIRRGVFSSSKITTQLISSSCLHSSCGYGLRLFDSFSEPNVYCFNALIRGLAETSLFAKSIEFFKRMLHVDVRPNGLTFPFVMKSVAGLGQKSLGTAVHGKIVKCGVELDSFVRVSLVDMYVKLDLLGFGLQLFDESPERNKNESVLLWNVTINGCCKNGILDKAVGLFEAMPERNLGSWNSLINGLMQNDQVDKAMELFERMGEKNVVTWTTVVHGLSRNGMHEKALDMFFMLIEEEGVRLNDLTLVSILSSCAKLGALDAGMRIHDFVKMNGFRISAALGAALVDMYAKCGNIHSAQRVFSYAKERDIRTWSVMIWGFAVHGYVKEALQCFERMKLAGTEPDEVAFLAVLTACSYAGEVDQGLKLFESMKLDYSIHPTMKHYAVVVDLYGRSGQLDEALEFIQSMELTPDFVIWGALFTACRAHKNTDMAKFVAKELLKLDPKHSGGYVFMSNVYASLGTWEEVERVRTSMKDQGAVKHPGWSYMEVDGKVHSFIAGDHSHMHTQDIYSKLDEITMRARELGYRPETEWVLHDIEKEEKEDALESHSEKLALAFGLISTGPSVVIRIIKNVRICGDCHSLMKHVSKLSQREIVVRDMKRFHHFKNGSCSCQDYW